ncbi:MAG: transcriptional repressor [Herbaspirillum sp.]|jgi:Fur family ferric uptake transcriptional regulator|nr:transcriptional repressor [Herbaspirillum sp.]
MTVKSAPRKSAAPAPDAGEARAYAELLLRDASVRVTSARTKVLSTLLTTRTALSHQDLQDTFTEMDRVTLYRALECLTEAKLAHKIAVDDRIFRYSAGAEHHEHAEGGAHRKPHTQHQHGHFKCTRCAKVFCLDDTDDATFLGSVLPADGDRHSAALQLQSALEKTLGKGFQSHEVELTIKGWCADCARQDA